MPVNANHDSRADMQKGIKRFTIVKVCFSSGGGKLTKKIFEMFRGWRSGKSQKKGEGVPCWGGGRGTTTLCSCYQGPRKEASLLGFGGTHNKKTNGHSDLETISAFYLHYPNFPQYIPLTIRFTPIHFGPVWPKNTILKQQGNLQQNSLCLELCFTFKEI